MSGTFFFLMATLLALWAAWPPRGTRRRWLALALAALWLALVAVGLEQQIQPGFTPWLLLLALIGALVALLVLWSLATLLARRGQDRDE